MGRKRTLDEEIEAERPTKKVRRPIDPEELEARSKRLADAELERAALEEKKTTKAREFTAKIRVLGEEIERLSNEVSSGEEEVDAQQELLPAARSRRGAQRGTQDAGAPVGQEP